MYKFLPPLIVLVPHNLNLTLYVQLRVVCAIVQLSSGSVSHLATQ